MTLPPLPPGLKPELPPLPLGLLFPPPPPMPAVEIPAYHSKPVVIFDTECYYDYWLAKFRFADSKTTVEFETYPGKPLDVDGLLHMLTEFTVVTFNGLNYDMPMTTLACTGADTTTLKLANDAIIVGRLKYWDFYKQYRLSDPLDGRYQTPLIDHIDLIEVAPGVGVSLKLYGGRMHSKRMQELPFDPKLPIIPEQRAPLSHYCGNDTLVTLDLYTACIERLELRAAIGQEFGIDVRSKSDAQAGEAVVKSEIGFKVEKAFWQHGAQFQYQVPDFISFQTPYMQGVLEMVRAAVFTVSDKDQVDDTEDTNGEKIKTGVIMPKELKDAKVALGSSVYRMGIGGLHSSEQSTYHIATPGVCTLVDADVTSYYPDIIEKQGLYPPQLGPEFLVIYTGLKRARVHAKAMAKTCLDQAKLLDKNANTEAGFFESNDRAAALRKEAKVWKTKADGYKIMINGLFGKLGSKYSILFAPDLLIQTTITGQLSLLMLIEALEQAGIPVVSANTDGVVIKCPVGLEFIRDAIIKNWERQTAFTMEFTNYVSIYSRDVNNYLAIKADGEVKTKGVFAETGLQKNPTNAICVKAVTAYLSKGVHPASTIRESQDVRDFLTVRSVTGGAVKGGEYIGKVCRWLYAKNEYGCLNYGTNGNKVPRSEGALPMMDLPEQFPADVIDYDWYIRESYGMLSELGLR